TSGAGSAFEKSSDKMYGKESASELRHFGAAHGRLQPLSMVKGGVPIIDGGVIAAERELEKIIVFETDDAALYLRIESSCRRCSIDADARIRARRERQFPEEADFGRKVGIQMKCELPFRKAAL